VTLAALALASGSALAAKKKQLAPADPPPAPAPYSWTGFYIGANLGYAWGNNQIELLYPPLSPPPGPRLAAIFGGGPPIPVDPSGLVGGGQVGYNWQFNQAWLAGLEADFDFADVHGSGAVTYSFHPGPQGFQPLTTTTANERVDWFGTVRARLGYLPTNNLLIYGTGGFAYGKVSQNGSLFNDFFSDTEDDGTCPVGICFTGASTHIVPGWTAGGGLEYALWKNWTVKAEYLYIRLRGSNFTENVLLPGFTNASASYLAQGSDIVLNVVRGGLNYKF